MGTVLVGLVVLIITSLAIRSIYKDKKAGKCCKCGGDCGYCRNSCKDKK